MASLHSRKGWFRVFAAVSGSVFFAGCVTDLQARDFITTTLVRTFWTAVSSYAQAAVIDRQQQSQDAQQSGN